MGHAMLLHRSLTSALAGVIPILSLLFASACGGSAQLSTSAGTAGDTSLASDGEDHAGASGNSGGAGMSGNGSAGMSGSVGVSGSVSGSGSGGANGGITGTGRITGALDCTGVFCNNPTNCAQDQIRKQVLGNCCPVCAPKPPECTQAEADYLVEVSALTTPTSATSCTTDDDCTMLPSAFQCLDDCGGSAVNVGSLMQLQTELRHWADSHCNVCGVPLRHSCPHEAGSGPVCENGTCVVHD